MTATGASTAVPIGQYALQLGTDSGSFAQFEPVGEDENAAALAAALDKRGERNHTLVDASEHVNTSATQVGGKSGKRPKVPKEIPDFWWEDLKFVEKQRALTPA
jgi:hypothetical protein